MTAGHEDRLLEHGAETEEERRELEREMELEIDAAVAEAADERYPY